MGFAMSGDAAGKTSVFRIHTSSTPAGMPITAPPVTFRVGIAEGAFTRLVISLSPPWTSLITA